MTTQTFTELMAKLPHVAIVTHPTDGHDILVKRGVVGFFEIDDLEAVRTFNDHTSDRQLKAMLHGSMFGFDTPGADPDHYMQDHVP